MERVHWLMLGIFRLKARGQWFLLYFSFGLVECVVVVLLVLDNQLPSHRARDNSSSAAHVSIPSTKPIRFGAPRIVAIIPGMVKFYIILFIILIIRQTHS